MSQNVPLTENQLNQLLTKPEPIKDPGIGAYKCYILWSGWKMMEPARMKSILERMLSGNQFNSHQKTQIENTLDELTKIETK